MRNPFDADFYVLCPVCLTYVNPEKQTTLCPHPAKPEEGK